MSRKVVVTGATGLLGRQVVRTFERAGWDVLATGLSRAKPPSIVKVDLGDVKQVDSLLDEHRPQVIVHCAANRSPDSCNASPEAARRSNVDASGHLARAAARHGILIIYISTDYVFSGEAGQAPYDTTAVPAPSNLYGLTKLEGERIVLKETHSSHLGLVLRVPVLYGDADTPADSAINTLMDAVWRVQDPKNRPLKMDDWARRFPTNTEDVARVILDITTKFLASSSAEQRSLTRTFQFSSEDVYTKYEICQVFATLLGLPLDGMIADKAAPQVSPGSVQRPYDTHLSTRSLQEWGIATHTQNFESWWRLYLGAYRK